MIDVIIDSAQTPPTRYALKFSQEYLCIIIPIEGEASCELNELQ